MRSSSTAPHTMANASSVPMFTMLNSVSIGTNAVTTQRIPPVSIVDKCGVRKRGWTVAKSGGNSPSRAIARKIRAWLSRLMSITLVIPAMAPVEMRIVDACSAQLSSLTDLRKKASATAASGSMTGYGSMPVMTADTPKYSTEQMANELRMPMGTSRCGFLASSECVEMASNPM